MTRFEFILAAIEKHRPMIEANAEALRAIDRERSRVYMNRRLKTDVEFKILSGLRSRMRSALKGIPHTSTTRRLLGGTPFEVRCHIQKLWKRGMSWANHGSGEGKWHIDHIRPCASFNLRREEDRRACFHYTNLQPLWSHENFAKNSRWEGKLVRKKPQTAP